VFIQNPSPYVGFDGYQENGVKGFWLSVKNYCLLKGASFPATLLRNIHVTFLGGRVHSHLPCIFDHRNLFASRDTHVLLEKLHPKSAKFTHVRSVLTGLYQLKPNDNADYRILHPLFLQNILAAVLYEPVSSFFDGVHDRIFIRTAFAESSGYSAAWRRTKRPSSGLVFEFFHNNEELLKNFLGTGITVRASGVDRDWIDHEVSLNAKSSLTENVGLLLNFLRLEIFARSLKRHILSA